MEVTKEDLKTLEVLNPNTIAYKRDTESQTTFCIEIEGYNIEKISHKDQGTTAKVTINLIPTLWNKYLKIPRLPLYLTRKGIYKKP
jgi:hypothetical protein